MRKGEGRIAEEESDGITIAGSFAGPGSTDRALKALEGTLGRGGTTVAEVFCVATDMGDDGRVSEGEPVL